MERTDIYTEEVIYTQMAFIDPIKGKFVMYLDFFKSCYH